MMEHIDIFCENDGKHYMLEEGSRISDLLAKAGCACRFPIIAALENNLLKELDRRLYSPCKIRFIDRSHPDGRRTYMRSLCFVVQKAVAELFPDKCLTYDYSLPNGLYAEIREAGIAYGEKPTAVRIDEGDMERIRERVAGLIAADLPFLKSKADAEDAAGIFRKNRQPQKAELIESLGRFTTSLYSFDGWKDTFYGPLAPSSGTLDTYDIYRFGEGFCIRWPSIDAPERLTSFRMQDKLYSVLKEHSDWCHIMGVSGVGSLNRCILEGKAKGLINISESLHERKYARIADMIQARRDRIRIVAIAGPSSSAKTTTSKRIALQCKVLGLNPVVVELDNYFVNREFTPKDEKGDYDFESIKAMDLKLLNSNLNDLLDGKEIEMPRFNFAEGKREYRGDRLKMKEDDILIIEGIHALNPEMTAEIDAGRIFKVYASALTSLSLDENNNISTSDNRLLRRIVRDNRTRGISPENTILRWPSVRSGETKNIFPFQENADAMFNSALIFELPALKFYVAPLLRRISPKSEAYTEAVRLLKFLDYTVTLSPEEIAAIPPTSIMREFIGGGSL